MIDRHRTSGLSPAGVAIVLSLVSLAFCVSSDPANAKRWFKKSGGGTLVAVDSLYPTQATVQAGRLSKKSRKLASAGGDPREIDKVLSKKPVQAVLGPGGKLFITDGHHRTTAAIRAGLPSIRVQVTEDLSALTEAEFWQRLQSTGRAHLTDAAGRRISPSRLPSTVRALDTVR